MFSGPGVSSVFWQGVARTDAIVAASLAAVAASDVLAADVGLVALGGGVGRVFAGRVFSWRVRAGRVRAGRVIAGFWVSDLRALARQACAARWARRAARAELLAQPARARLARPALADGAIVPPELPAREAAAG
jgi:hypothetical protein